MTNSCLLKLRKGQSGLGRRLSMARGWAVWGRGQLVVTGKGRSGKSSQGHKRTGGSWNPKSCALGGHERTFSG